MADEYTSAAPPNSRGSPFVADFIWRLALEGRIFISSDGDADDLVLGQTSFASTTPTFLLDIPGDAVALPLALNLSQSGTVAGGAVNVIMALYRGPSIYASGGVTEKVFNPQSGNDPNKCTLYTNPTVTDAYGIRIWGATVGQDVSPAEGAVPGPYWKPEVPIPFRGPASLLIYTYAATTAPSWLWSLYWAEWTTSEYRMWHGVD